MTTPFSWIRWKLYGPLMRLAHRFNWHHTKTCHPQGGEYIDTLVVCDWCGLRWVKERHYYGGTDSKALPPTVAREQRTR